MKFRFNIDEAEYEINTELVVDISIPMLFNGEQPNTYDVPKAEAKAYKQGDFIGDVQRGGGCNFEKYTLIPHCNGTHTECVGHISYENISINNTLKDALIPATLVTVKPVNSVETDDRYIPDKGAEDMLITRLSLEEALANGDSAFTKALIIRTLPNDISKKSRKYMNNHPAFFSLDAMEFIVELGVEHLLIDLPSVDRTFDEGKLTTHHIFWGVEKESHNIDTKNHSMKTITEMIYVPYDAEDGEYIVNIQIPNFTSDAAPSRILVYQVSSL